MDRSVAQALLVAVALLTAATAGRPASAQESTPGYWVQIAVMNAEAAARRRADEIAAKVPAIAQAKAEGRIIVIKYSGPKGEWWRVRVGPFPDRPQALVYCKELRAAAQSCLVAD